MLFLIRAAVKMDPLSDSGGSGIDFCRFNRLLILITGGNGDGWGALQAVRFAQQCVPDIFLDSRATAERQTSVGVLEAVERRSSPLQWPGFLNRTRHRGSLCLRSSRTATGIRPPTFPATVPASSGGDSRGGGVARHCCRSRFGTGRCQTESESVGETSCHPVAR